MSPFSTTAPADARAAEDADLVRCLDSTGALHTQPDLPDGVAPLDLKQALLHMTLARRLDTEAVALQRQGELGLWPSLLGQEGAQVGAAAALGARDVVFPTYREHAVAGCRGVDPVALLGLFRGSTMGGWDPVETGVQPYTLVIGAHSLHGVGYAMGLVRDGDVGTGEPGRDRAVVVFLGDGALSEGETNEAFVWAATMDLPVVFFCQNNQWAISAPFSTQSRVPVAQRAAGFGFPGVRVDGNDVVACHAVTAQALARARSGGGPTLVEAVTYRRNPHTTSDDDGRYRPAAENDHWAALDPIDRLRSHLESLEGPAGVEGLDAAFVAELEAADRTLAARVRRGCRELPDPPPDDPFLHTLATMTPELARQRAAHLAFLADDDTPAPGSLDAVLAATGSPA